MQSNKHRKRRVQTATKVSAATEWTDYHGMLELFGLRRTTTYHPAKHEPELRGATISFKNKSENLGKRLFNVRKVRRWLESKQMSEPQE